MTEASTRKQIISCVIPCYKSHDTVGEVVSELETALETRADEFTYEIILVNDGSPDEGQTAAKLRELAEDDEHLVVVNLARNFGQHRAIMAGFKYVAGDIVVVLDDDMQTPGDEVFKLVDKVIEGYDIAYADYQLRHHAGWRNLGSKFNAWCSRKFMNIPKGLYIENYYAVTRMCVDNAIKYENPYPYVDGLLFESVDTWTTVPITHRAREVGKSGYTMHSLIGLWLNGFTAFSVKPLRFASLLGFFFSILGALGIIFVLIEKLLNPGDAEGWSSLMVALLFIGGLLMLMIGMIGEYVGRIYLSINKMPQYVIRWVDDKREKSSDDEQTGSRGDV
jgi:glycosyltransferase involved in cell wall biosynthesis